MKFTVNCKALSQDCKRVAKDKNTTYTVMMESNGINNGFIANCRARYQLESAKRGIVLPKDCEWGICSKDKLIKICEVFELADAKGYLHESELERWILSELPQQEEAPVDDLAQLKADVQNIGLLLLDIRNLLHSIHTELV